jgi:hypothetical protein
MKRQRGRGRKPGGGGHQNPNKALDSQGPDVRVRGSAQTIFEKYQALARDALAAGDRILAENYLQHAEHYLRLLKSMQPAFIPRADMMVSGYAGEGDDAFEDDEDGEGDGNDEGSWQGQREQREYQPRREFERREPREPREQRDYQPRSEGRNDNRGEGRGEARSEARPDGEGADADGDRRFGRNRNRNRRDRFRSGGYGEGAQAEGGETPREAREPREHREPREQRGPDPLAVQGFDAGPPLEEVRGFEPQSTGGDDADRPARRQRPPRPPRETREPREAREPATGFGDSVPSFLAPVSMPVQAD